MCDESYDLFTIPQDLFFVKIQGRILQSTSVVCRCETAALDKAAVGRYNRDEKFETNSKIRKTETATTQRGKK